jgi:hypothetical protein
VEDFAGGVSANEAGRDWSWTRPEATPDLASNTANIEIGRHPDLPPCESIWGTAHVGFYDD